MEDDIKQACKVMHQGGVILYPTDTVWGIGCDATNFQAVERVFQIKHRNDNKAMLVLVDNPVKAERYVQQIPSLAWDLMELSVKPLTIIFPQACNLAPNLLGTDGSIGIRITKERFSQKLCERFRKPIVSTSANVSGQPTPLTYAQISQEIKQAVDYIVRFRQDEINKAVPSSIIRMETTGVVQIIRE